MILPICRPSIVSYLHHADYLSIVETDSRSQHYLINNFLQLYSRENNTAAAGRELVVDFYSYEGAYARYPFIHIAWLNGATLRALGGNAAEQARAAIDSGCYIEALLDEYYVKGKRAYRQAHVPHQSLIYGYAAAQREFLAQGFCEDGSFGEFTIAFDDFSAASRADLGMSVISRTDALEYNNSQAFAPALITAYLTDFIEARSSFVSFQLDGSAYGCATYDVAVQKVVVDNGDAIDIRPWCIFHEHKLKLLGLHDYLCKERRATIDPRVRQGLAQLANDFLGIRNYLLESRLSGRAVKVDALKNNIARCTETEAGLIEDLIDAVGKGEGSTGLPGRLRQLLPAQASPVTAP